jgi:hypothetical protein
VRELFELLEVEENRIAILEGVGAIFEFAHNRGGKQWTDTHQQCRMVDGPEKMPELKQEEDGASSSLSSIGFLRGSRMRTIKF